MAEIRATRVEERIIALDCDVCEKRMTLGQDSIGKLIFDNKDNNDWEEKHLCPECYGKVLDHVNVDMVKELRNEN